MAIKHNSGFTHFYIISLWLCGAMVMICTASTTSPSTTPPNKIVENDTTTVVTTQPTTKTTTKTTTVTTTTTPTPTTTATSTITNSTPTTPTTPTTTPTTKGTTVTPYPEFEDSEYLFQQQNTTVNFTEALDSCTEWGGSLVSIHLEEENKFVQSLVADETSWIGLKRDAGGNYTWTDGSLYDFNNWAINISITGCLVAVFQKSDGKWLNENCDAEQLSYICKRMKTTTTSMASTTHAGPNTEDKGSSGLSDPAVIVVSIALILVVIALSLAAVTYFIKKKRAPKQDAFSLLDNDQADFVNTNTVTIDDHY